MITAPMPGVVAAEYAKTIGGVAYAASFDPSSSARRTYDAVRGFSAPQYVDTPGWTSWAAGGPIAALIAKGYTLQAKVTYSRFEGLNTISDGHSSALSIGGTNIEEARSPTSDTGWFNVSSALSGTITFHDWCNNTSGVGGTAYTGNIQLFYRYIRA